MKQLLHLLLLMFLVPAIGAQSERDEYVFGKTGAPKDYDAKTDIPKDYDPETDESRSYDASEDTPKDYEVTGDLPNYYDETTAKPVDFDEKTDKAQDYDEDYVEGILYEPGGRLAYRIQRIDRQGSGLGFTNPVEDEDEDTEIGGVRTR